MSKKKRLGLLLALACALLLGGGLSWRVLKHRGKALPFAALADSGPRKRQPLEPAEVLYDGKLGPGWSDWGWGPHELGKGPAKIKFAGFGGIVLQHPPLRGPYGGLAFRFKAPAAFGDFLHVSLRVEGKPDDAFPLVPLASRHVADLGDGWREALVDWHELNPDGEVFDRVLIGSRLQVPNEWVLLERVMLTRPVAVSPSGDDGLGVLCKAATHPISELIYGGASGDWSSGQSAQRMGGNPLSRFNWELGAWNVGADWYFENAQQKMNAFEMLSDARKERRWVAIVVPMIGWVSKDATSVGFPRDKFGPQKKYDPYRPEAGNGERPDGSLIEPGEPTQTSVPAPPELIARWIRRVVEEDQRAGVRAAHMYILDNEPSLWNTTHRDVRPKPLGYDELLDRTIKYASAIRDADPDALIAGPAEWGWTGYGFSAVDREAGVRARPDRLAHDNTPLVAWYLRKLAEHERKSGKRLLDVFDLHFYPAADGVYVGGQGGTDPATSELRLRSTRALWDPEYEDESWIKEEVRLIPRMKEWVRDNYPGRKISIGEWSFGAEKHISGGLATAEALGRFGQQGLDAAFHWGGMDEETPTYWAFRAFRNFDGKGARFQDVSLAVREMEQVSLFASRDTANRRMVLVAINRQPTTRQAVTVALDGCARAKSVRRFSYAADSKGLVEGRAELKPGAVALTLEPYSINVLELEL